MKLEKYITQLLYRYPCVTVFGFGAFLAEVRSVRLQPSTNTFYPPAKMISFNSMLQTNDGLLAHYIAQSEQISYSEAIQLIQEEVALWKKELNNLKVLIIGQIGEFRLNAENNMVFVAYDTVNYLTSSFGLSAVTTPVIRRNYSQQTLTSIIDESKAEAPRIVKDVPNVSGEKQPNRWFRYVAAASVVIGLAVLTANQYYGYYINQQTLLVEKQVQQEVEARIQKATFVMNDVTLSSTTLSIKENNLNYHIVAGAFQSEENAQAKQKELSDQGFKSRKLGKNKRGLYPVLYGSYNTYEEAQIQLSQIRQNDSDAWILFEEI